MRIDFTRTLAAACLITVTAPLALAGCDDDRASTVSEPSFSKLEDTESQDAAPQDTALQDAATGSTAAATTVTLAAPGASKAAEETAAACANLPKDPRQVYATGTAPGRMPAVDVDSVINNYWISDIENSYDPCAPISWIVFHGQNGSAEGPGQTGASVNDGLALYANGVPANEMVEFERVESVTPVGGNAVELTWGERTQGTAAGVTEHFTVRIEADGTSVRAVSGDADRFNTYWNDSRLQFQLGTYD